MPRKPSSVAAPSAVRSAPAQMPCLRRHDQRVHIGVGFGGVDGCAQSGRDFRGDGVAALGSLTVMRAT